MVLCSFFCIDYCNAESIKESKSRGSEITILYNDVNIYRRSLDSAPKIGSGLEENIIKMRCDGGESCVNRIGKLYAVLSERSVKGAICDKPIYFRLDLYSDESKYGGNTSREVFDVDYSGKCLEYSGKVFSLNKSVFEVILGSPIPEW